jgi:hypothetical protein
MRIDDIIIENQNLEEGPIWDKTRQVGAAVGKGLGAVGQGIGAVAGVPAGIARAIGKGYNRAADTIAGGPDENPQQGGTQYQPSGQQQSAAGQAQAVAGQSAEDPATMRKQARDLMARADEIERQQKQTSQSAPSQQTTQPNQSTGNATSGQTQNTGTGQQASQAQQEPQAQPNQTQQEPQAQQTTQAPADNVSTPSSTNGQINQTSTGLVHKADSNNPNNKQSTSAKPNADVTDVEPKTKSPTNPLSLPAPTAATTANYGKQIPGYGQTTMNAPPGIPGQGPAVPTTNNKDQQANLKARLKSGQGMGKKGNSGFTKSGVGKPVQKMVGADKQGNPVFEPVREDIQYYSRFLRAMI